MRADKAYTDRLTDDTSGRKAAKDNDGLSSSPLLIECQFDVSTVPGEGPKVIHITNTCPLHLKAITHSFYNSIFLSLEPQRPKLQNCPDCILNLHKSSVSISHFPTMSFRLATPSLSLSSQNPFKSPTNSIVI